MTSIILVPGKKKNLKVTQIYPEEGKERNLFHDLHMNRMKKRYKHKYSLFVGNMAKVLPKYLSDWTTNKVANGNNFMR